MTGTFDLEFIWPKGVTPPEGAPRTIALASTRLDHAEQEAERLWLEHGKRLQPRPLLARIRDLSEAAACAESLAHA